MSFIACGINHKTAPVALRERLSFAADAAQPLQLLQQQGANEAAILSTCNRTEIYCTGTDAGTLQQWLAQDRKVDIAQLQPHFYTHQSQQALRHVMRVACGLDSMVLGEPEIFGQLKQAFGVADSAGTIGQQFKQIFPFIFSSSKRVRNQSAIGVNPVSVARVAVTQIERLFANLNQLTALLIGTGDTIEQIARQLHCEGIQRMIVANRTLSHAEPLAERYQGEAIEMGKLNNYLAQADIIVSATASPVPILGKGRLETAIKLRRHKPMFLIDLAVPRDIEEEVAELADCYLYNIDDLQTIAAQSLQSRQDAAQHAEQLIEEELVRFTKQQQQRQADPVIAALQSQGLDIQKNLLAKAQKRLRAGEKAEDVVARLAHDLTKQLLHGPTTSLRAFAGSDQQTLINLSKQLFQLED